MAEKPGMREAIDRVARNLADKPQRDGEKLTFAQAQQRVAQAVRKGDMKREEK